MAAASFGNDPAKIGRYRAFWKREDVQRPLVGFSLMGWFPFDEFAPCTEWGDAGYLTPEMIDPEAFLEDHVRLLREGEMLDDDVIRGCCPGQVAIPWIPAMIGAKVRILPHNTMAEEQHLSWDEALAAAHLDPDNPWFRKYVAFAEALVRVAAGRFPVSHSAELGISDLHAVLRGHTGSIMDLTDEPGKSAELLCRLGKVFQEATEGLWKRLPLYHGGYFDAQYCLWAPGPIVRLQEDASAVYSPDLLRRFVQPIDRQIASRFACSFIHLHSTSMFLLDAFLEMEEIRCFEINHDTLGPPLQEMIPHFRKVQQARRPLLIRGSFSTEEMRLLMDSLEPRGLFLDVMANSMEEVEALRPILGM
ncbi:MAG: hypothetical protein M1436_06055 [Acidobacteria bacterium]|nr:hypothetical protein [Acidobacteriota bacterium]